MKSFPHNLCAILLFLALTVPAPAVSGQSDSNCTSWFPGGRRHPFLEFAYGIDWPRHKYLEAGLPSVGVLEVRAGYVRTDTVKNGILSFGNSFLTGSWYNSNLGGGSGGTEGFSGKLSRFGLGYGDGFGYDLGGSAIVPYFITDLSWTELKTTRPTTLSQSDIDILERYEGTYRFGSSAESGIRANIGPTLSVSGGYEVNIVYPRIVFWELVGGYAVAGAANGIISWFGDDMLESSPSLGPVFYFLIRTGAAWGIYQLWREDMNWPFSSETPLTHEALKFGMSFTL